MPQITPATLKRTREGGDEKVLPAEAIMLPLSAPAPSPMGVGIIKRTPGGGVRKSFTPRRNVVLGAGQAAENAVGGDKSVSRNIFATATPGGGGRNLF